MKKVFWALVLVLIFGNLLRFVLPWWGIVLAGVVAGAWLAAPRSVAAGAFAGGLLFWGGSAFLQDIGNEGILSARVGALFGGASGFQMVLLTGVLGGLLALLGGLCGAFGRRAVFPAEQ